MLIRDGQNVSQKFQNKRNAPGKSCWARDIS